MLITSFASPFAGSSSSKNTSPPQETQATPTRAEASQNQPAETQPTQQTRSQETSSSQPVEASRSTLASPSSDDQPASASASASATPSGEPAQSASTSPEPAANMDRMARAVEQRNVDTPAATIATQDRQTILSSQALEAEEIQARNAAENQQRTEQLLSLASKNYTLTQDLFRSRPEAATDPQPNPTVIRDPKAD